MKRLLVFAALGAMAALAGDISGSWKATAPGPTGVMERTFIFHVSDGKVTGETTSSVLGTSIIENGKLEGSILTFTITAKGKDGLMKLRYQGRIRGDLIDLTSETVGGGPKVHWTARRGS
jgi:hypothetical protein